VQFQILVQAGRPSSPGGPQESCTPHQACKRDWHGSKACGTGRPQHPGPVLMHACAPWKPLGQVVQSYGKFITSIISDVGRTVNIWVASLWTRTAPLSSFVQPMLPAALRSHVGVRDSSTDAICATTCLMRVWMQHMLPVLVSNFRASCCFTVNLGCFMGLVTPSHRKMQISGDRVLRPAGHGPRER